MINKQTDHIQVKFDLIRAMLPHVPFDGWSFEALEQGAIDIDFEQEKNIDVRMDIYRDLFKNGSIDFIDVFSEMIDIVFKYDGTLDKIIGDELMVVFGAPLTAKDDTERALKTAIEMQSKIKDLNKIRKQRKENPVLVGAGINKGYVVSGNIGSRDMMDYTVIGDTVNLGARLCSSAGPGEIIVSKEVVKKNKDKFSFEVMDPINVKGKKNKIDIYKVKY